MSHYRFLIVFLVFLSINVSAQKIGKNFLPIKTDNTPTWFHVFYMPDLAQTINVHDLDKIVKNYEDSLKTAFQQSLPADYEVQTGEEHENDYLRYYKRWRRSVGDYVQDNGTLKNNENPEFYKDRSRTTASLRSPTSNWRVMGPLSTHSPYSASNTTQPEISSQVNIYACAMATSNHNILYAAPETGGIFKTIDKGANWTLVLDELNVGSQPFANYSGDGFYSIDINPTNPNIVYVGRTNLIKKSTDGGVTWTSATPACGDVNTIAINPNNTNEIFAACENGLYKSIDAGTTWSQILTNNMRDVTLKLGTPSTVYVLREATTDVITFWKSTDGGANFTQISWGTNFTETRGARMTVSANDPTRIYAVVLPLQVGGVADDRPYIFKSTDSGDSWTKMCVGTYRFDNLGGTTDAPLGMSSGQGYYDLDIIANPSNANEVIVATTTAYKSTDGGANFTRLGGYAGPFPIHADIQCMIADGTDTWISTDGGMNYSTDFFSNTANMSVRNKGIFGSDFWGFTQGWNEDILGGGKYHNGNSILSEAYPAGKATDHQGGESATGFYMIGRKRHIAFSDVPGTNKGVIAPETFTSPAGSFIFTKFPNEDNPGRNVSEVEFLPYCYGHMYMGEGNNLWKSTDRGITWVSVYDFLSPVREFEISRSNPDVIYLCTDAALLKSTNGGTSWTAITTLPAGQNQTEKRITLSFTDENTLWITARSNTSNNRVFKTINGGASWINLTTPTIDAGGYNNIVHQAGTTDGVYILRKGGTVFYRNNTMTDWADFSASLPKGTYPLKSIPFYRDSKLRMAGNRGIWEIDFYEEGTPIAQPTVDKLTANCSKDTFYFEDYSVLKHTGATTWSWSFTGTSTPTYISSTAERNPKVVFGAAGTYSFSLTVTNAAGTSTKAINGKIIVTNTNCSMDTLPLTAASLTGSANDFLITEQAFSNSDNFSISFWMKSSDAGSIRTILGTRNVSSSTGNTNQGWAFVLRAGKLHFELGDGSAVRRVSTPSNINDGAWHYIAGTVTKGGNMTLFVDGISIGTVVLSLPNSINNGSQLYIGKDNNGAEPAYPFTGQIDEVKIWNTALTIEAIREKRHLTAYLAQEPNLVAYYQFNDATTFDYDRKRVNNLIFWGASTRIASTAPVGGGTFARLNVNSSGVKTFTGTDCEIEFPAIGTGITYPNGDIVVTALNVAPDQVPTTGSITPLSTKYWIVNNYGSNAAFSTLTSLKFSNLGTFAAGATNGFNLYKRASNSDATWGTAIDASDAIALANNYTMTFSTNNNITSFSQFTIAKDNTVLPLDLLSFSATPVDNTRVQLAWQTTNEKNVSYFEVERSTDSKFFTPLSKTLAKNGFSLNDYQSIDEKPFSGVSYYRLKMMDKDGLFTYSPIKSVSLKENEKFNIKVFPNPTSDKLNIEFQSDNSKEVTIDMYNVYGHLVYSYKLEGRIGNNRLFFNTHQFSAGLYTLKIKQDNAETTKKIVIE
jgi:photosystem II stability/assembly factor-like uncharacterized protein